MAGKHSRLGPSGAHRWMRCAGAPAAEHGINDTAGHYAAEGTFYHGVASDCMITGLDPRDFIGMTGWADGFEFTFTEEMAEHLQPALDRIAELSSGQFAQVVVEQSLDLQSWLGPGEFGTLDVGIFDPIALEATIFDHKYGQGVIVDVIENEQLMLYGLGFWHSYIAAQIEQHLAAGADLDDMKFRLIIDQPRVPGGGGEWETTLGRLLEFGDKAREAAQLTRNPAAVRTPGLKQCQFCKAKGTCPDLAAFNLEHFGLMFANLDGDPTEVPDLPVTTELTPERRSYIVRHRALFDQWMDALHADVLTDALQGRETPGLKAVAGREGNRAWVNESRVAAVLEPLLGKDTWKRTLISPAQVEKKNVSVETWKTLNGLIKRPEGKPSIVPVEDPRPSLTAALDHFRNLDDDKQAESLI